MQYAIKSNFTNEKLNKAIERYRLAQLTMFKAKSHEIQEKEFQKKPHHSSIELIEKEIVKWTNKTAEEIINEIKAVLQ